MPYSKIIDLPPEVQDSLTEDEQRIWLEVWNRVFEQTQDEEKAFQAAWGAVNKQHVKAALGLKSASDGGVFVVGWGMLFDDGGDPDLHQQFFTEATELLSEQYADAPLFYDHGGDPAYGSKPIGQRVNLETYPHGVWVEHRLFPDHPQYLRTLQEARDGLLFYSGDTFHHLIQNDFDSLTGEIGFWPTAGWSLVRDPAEPGLGPVSLKELAAAAKAARLNRAGSERDAAADKTASVPEVREAPASGATAQPQTDEPQAVGATNMEQLLQLLAQFFGVDPTPEAVAPLLDEFITWLGGGEAASAERFAALDMAAMKSAFELAADADNAALVEKFTGFKTALTPAPQPDYGLLKQGAALLAAAKSAPAVPDPIGHQTGGSQAFGAKSARIAAPNINRGTPEPGVADLVIGLLSGNAKQIAAASKSVGVSENVRGGYLTRRETASEILKQLEDREVVMAAGAQIERMDGIQSLTTYKDLSNIQAYWRGEHQVVGQSEIKQVPILLNLKELVAEVRVSKRKLRASTQDTERFLRDEMIRKMRLRMDKSFFMGIGAKPGEAGHSGAEPLGIVNVPGINTVALGANGAYPGFADLGKFPKLLKKENVEESETWAWVTHGSLVEDINNITDTTGQPLMRENWAGKERPTWRGYSHYDTNQLPTNLVKGTSSDCTYLVLADWQYVVVGLGMDVEIAVSEEVYFREGDVLIQAVAMVDMMVAYPQAIAVCADARIRA